MSHTGGCLCAAITYEFPNDPEVYGLCHCLNCQKQAGTAFSTLAPVPKAEFELAESRNSTLTGTPAAAIP